MPSEGRYSTNQLFYVRLTSCHPLYTERIRKKRQDEAIQAHCWLNRMGHVRLQTTHKILVDVSRCRLHEPLWPLQWDGMSHALRGATTGRLPLTAAARVW